MQIAFFLKSPTQKGTEIRTQKIQEYPCHQLGGLVDIELLQAVLLRANEEKADLLHLTYARNDWGRYGKPTVRS